jgi:cytochrome c oxidase assembly protein subunit 15
MAEVLAGAPPGQMHRMAYRLFSRAAWGVLAYNILVVLWGAYVRATGSGDGCGNNWPLCKGTVVPRAPQAQTIIEFTHRASVLLAFVAVVALAIWAFRLFPRGHRARFFSALSLLFFFVEALLGAGLVLLRYVAQNASAGRAVYLSAHLVNTQVLLALLALTAWFGGDAKTRQWLRPARSIVAALPVALVVAVSGAIAALGDTLFPASSIASGMRQEFAGTAGALLRLRAVHPAVAVIGALFLLGAAVTALRSERPAAVRTGMAVAFLVFLQLLAGVLNIVLLAPVWMQILHLLLADLLWIALVVTTLEMGYVQPVSKG